MVGFMPATQLLSMVGMLVDDFSHVGNHRRRPPRMRGHRHYQ